MQGKLADCYVALNSARSYVYAVARAADRGKTTRFDAAGCILYASEAATRVALETIQALGGNGYTNDYPAGRLLRDAKLYEIGAGTNESGACSWAESFCVPSPRPLGPRRQHNRL
jgi:isovaleryl-CoA dehydrogenase